jgi:hypothetical protein
MRGINRGQTIHMLVIPEVKDLIQRELKRGQKAISLSFEHWNSSDPANIRRVLCDVSNYRCRT